MESPKQGWSFMYLRSRKKARVSGVGGMRVMGRLGAKWRPRDTAKKEGEIILVLISTQLGPWAECPSL